MSSIPFIGTCDDPHLIFLLLGQIAGLQEILVVFFGWDWTSLPKFGLVKREIKGIDKKLSLLGDIFPIKRADF